MTEINITNITKLSEFISYLEKLPKDFILSRGHSKDYKLIPSAFRRDENNNRLYSKSEIQNFIDSFKLNSYPYLKNPKDINSEKEWMVYAQHYGIPTKLLDFTYSHIVSLMFCIENAFNENDPEDGIIWFLNPKQLNLKSTNNCFSSIYTMATHDPEIEKASGPVAVTCSRIHERINAQNGLFIYFQEENNTISLQEYADDTILKKLIINKDSKKEILKSLCSLGIGYNSIYPELASISKDILLKKNIEQYVLSTEELSNEF